MASRRNREEPVVHLDAPSLPADPQPVEPELVETEEDTALAAEAGEPMVVFNGEATVREITAQEWEQAGVSGMPTVRWERSTGHQVAKSLFTDQALQVLRQDGGFRVP